MDDVWIVLQFCDGELLDESEHASRDAAEEGFALAVERANREAGELNVDFRVEMWGEHVLLAVYDTAHQP